MCLQCVADGSVYVGSAVGVLQVMKVRARARRLGAQPQPSPAQPEPAAPDDAAPEA